METLALDERIMLLDSMVGDLLNENTISPEVNGKKYKFDSDFEEFNTFVTFSKCFWDRVSSLEEIDESIRRIASNDSKLKSLIEGDYTRVQLKYVEGFNDDPRSHNPFNTCRGEWLSLQPYQIHDKEHYAFYKHGGFIEYDVEKNPTVEDLVRRVLYVKGSRFDTNYELYCGIKKHIISNNILRLDLTFDHGS